MEIIPEKFISLENQFILELRYDFNIKNKINLFPENYMIFMARSFAYTFSRKNILKLEQSFIP